VLFREGLTEREGDFRFLPRLPPVFSTVVVVVGVKFEVNVEGEDERAFNPFASVVIKKRRQRDFSTENKSKFKFIENFL
jgi:hypothetical protein